MAETRETSGRKAVLVLLAALVVVGGALWLAIKSMTPETVPEPHPEFRSRAAADARQESEPRPSPQPNPAARRDAAPGDAQ